MNLDIVSTAVKQETLLISPEKTFLGGHSRGHLTDDVWLRL